MARPLRKALSNGQSAWDALVNDNLVNLFDGPLPIHVIAGDEDDIETPFPAANHTQCLVWVNHSIWGWTLYFNDGGSWRPLKLRRAYETKTTGSPYDVVVGDDLLIINSSTAYTVTLPAPSGSKGMTYTIKNINTGLVTVDNNGSETLDGATTYLLGQYQSATFLSDGTNWHVVA